MNSPFDPLLSAIRSNHPATAAGETIAVSDTVSAAASAYEAVRNTLEYDEEHLLRRNAIRRILARRAQDEASQPLATDLLRELIWARYLPNKKIPEAMIDTVAAVFEKYRPLFSQARADARRAETLFAWLLDAASTEVEYVLAPPRVDEAEAGLAYRELKQRMVWANPAVKEEDRDLQLYIAVHRALLRSNTATLRFRVFTLYYPAWPKSKASDPIVGEIAHQLGAIVEAIEAQLRHRAADAVFRLVRQHGVVFHLLRDVAQDDPDAFAAAVAGHDTATLDKAILRAAEHRYDGFRKRLRTSVLRAVLFLFLTKMILALVLELPYEQFYLHSTDFRPLLVNIVFHPLLLSFIGLSVRIPEKKNNKKILEEVHAILGDGKDFAVTLKPGRRNGGLSLAFRFFYAVMFVLTVGGVASLLRFFHFNAFSIGLFLFFLSLVTFFGLKIRNGRREWVIVETGNHFLAFLGDLLFLPIVRAGRWISLRAPRINVFLFFLDFIIEAPFKAAIRVVESWLAFMKEKREEI